MAPMQLVAAVTFFPFTALQLIAAVIVSSLALIIYVGSKKPSSRAFLLLLVITIVWMCVTSVLPPRVWIDPAFRFDDYLGSLIAMSFFYFCLLYPEDTPPRRWVVGGLVLLGLVLAPLYYYGLIEYGNVYVGGVEEWFLFNGPLWFVRDAVFVGFATAGLFVLFRKYRRAADEKVRLNLRFMFWGMIIALVPSGLMSVILPDLGFTGLDWLSPFAVSVCILVIFYSVLRYRQMDVRTVAAEVLVIVMAILLFVNIFIGESVLGSAGKIALFLAFIIIGYSFIKSILKEAAQKEQLADLNENLNQKVIEQTKEIRTSYESERTARMSLERANEELKKLDRRKTEFLSVVAHQLRTPLSGIKWALAMLLGDTMHPLSDEQKKIVTLSQGGNERMISIVNQMLYAERIGEHGITELTRVPTDFVALVSEVVDELRLIAEPRRVTLSFTHDGHMPQAAVDRSMMRLAIQNLVENAIKYSPDSGTVHITVTADEHHVQFSVTNNGIAIPADQQRYIFTRFFRDRNAIAADPNGNGLGLFITKSILEGHGGTIWFTSEENKGTTFYFTFTL